MLIREAKIEEVNSIVELIQASYKFSYRGYVPDEYLDNLSITEDILKKWRSYLQKYECYVAEEENQIIAFLMLDNNKKIKTFEICVLYVKPKYQKQGIGSSLVKFACDMKKKNKYQKCELLTIKNGPSTTFYEKIDFIKTTEEKACKFTIPIIKFEKKL